jgi:endonuclease/exonuclease/phosphatase family metal-dependent hydrolase
MAQVRLLVALMAFAFWGAGALAEPLDLKVMTFNIWYGGEQVNFPTVAAALRAADADIVGVQEPDGNLERLAAAAGYAHVDARRNIISRYPLFDSGAGVRTEAGPAPYGIAALDAGQVHAWAMVRPGFVVAVANTHLSSDPYGPEAVRDGASLQDVLALEARVRMREARPLMALGALAQTGAPVFLTGDFNTPSHLDWGPAMQRARPTVIRYSIDWPVTRALAEAGLRDSYREAHRDPTQRLGYTWTAGMPHPYVRPNETIDRIDYVFVAGPVETLSSEIVGEPGGDGVDIPIAPYPSDHRGVVSRFRVTPVAAPALISVEPRTVARGADILVRGYDPAGEAWRAVIVVAGQPAAAVLARVEEDVGAWRRAARFASSELIRGEYDAVLLDGDGGELKRTRFAVRDGETPPSLEAVAPIVRAGANVRARWSNAPGHRHDWIGLARAGTPIGDYAASVYIDARFAGEAEIATAGLAPGPYELRLMRDDSNTIMARAPVTIR